MLSYCSKCRKTTESKTRGLQKQKIGKPMFFSKCAVCGS